VRIVPAGTGVPEPLQNACVNEVAFICTPPVAEAIPCVAVPKITSNLEALGAGFSYSLNTKLAVPPPEK
jgi:hypothetical protein